MCKKDCSRKPDARITAHQMRLPYTDDGHGSDRWTLELNKYQRDNLLELLRRTEHFANTGDWYRELRNVLELGPKNVEANPYWPLDVLD